jgi:hypothetical protein
MTATPVEPTVRPWEVHSSKVGPRHWERLAVVYVRQSTVQQVAVHQESTRLQYGLADRGGRAGLAGRAGAGDR